MSRKKQASSGLGVLALCVTLGSVGCVEERSFYILQNQLPAVVDGTCQAPAGGGTSLARGVLDVSLGVGYQMYPLVQFDIVSSEEEGVERNNFVLRRFEVGLDMSDVPGSFPKELTRFDYLSSGSLKPGTSLGTSVEVIPTELATQLANSFAAQTGGATTRFTVVATVQAVAVRLATDSEIESTTFHFPIDLCSGCLVQVLPVCPDEVGEEEKVPVYETNKCGLPQDGPVACCTRKDGRKTCLKQ